MTRESVQDLLQQLRATILSEREHAKALDLAGMAKDREQKEALLQVIGTIDNLHPMTAIWQKRSSRKICATPICLKQP